MKIGEQIEFKHKGQCMRARVIDINDEVVVMNVFCVYVEALQEWKGLGLYSETIFQREEIEVIRNL